MAYRFHLSACRDGEWHLDLGEIMEQLNGSRLRANLRNKLCKCLFMPLLQLLGVLLRDVVPGLPQQCIDKKPSTHTNAAMDSPCRKARRRSLQRFSPREDMLVDTVNERAVKIEQEG
jgi:hypothetical protein